MRENIRHPRLTDEHLIDEGCFIVELSNAPDDPDVSIARARVPPGVPLLKYPCASKLPYTPLPWFISPGVGLVL